MKIVLGTPINAVPKPWIYFHVPALLINALEVRKNPRAALSYEGELWIDSGGYQILRKNLNIDVRDIQNIYREIDAQLYFALDVPPSPQDSPAVAKKKFEKTYRNWLKMSKKLEVVPVLHIYREMGMFMKYLEKYLDAPALAIGGAVPYVLTTRGVPRGSRQMALSLIAEARRSYRGHLHVFGLGSPSITPILRAIGVDSTDTATWRLKAAYGKVILPGGGERHVTGRDVKFGKAKPKDGELSQLCQYLAKTGFPQLDGFYDRIAKSFEYRALVNAWVVLKSEEEPRSPTFRKLLLFQTKGLSTS